MRHVFYYLVYVRSMYTFSVRYDLCNCTEQHGENDFQSFGGAYLENKQQQERV